MPPEKGGVDRFPFPSRLTAGIRYGVIPHHSSVQPELLPGRVDMGQTVQPLTFSAVVAICSISSGISTDSIDTDAVNITP